jgi:membrane protein
VLGTGFLLLVSLALNVWIAASGIAVPRAATFMLSVLLIAVLFAVLYKTVPDVEVNWSDVALGAIITASLFTVGKQLMGLYFANTSFTSTYRAAGLPLAMLLWVYYSAQIFFWGAEFTKVYTRTVRSQWHRRHSSRAVVSACPVR